MRASQFSEAGRYLRSVAEHIVAGSGPEKKLKQ